MRPVQQTVNRGYLPLLLLVSSLWGASYLFIKVALEDMEPTTMMAIRLLLAGVVLFAVLVARSGLRRTVAELRAVGRHAFVLGVINGALPFWLIAWGEKYVDSGVAAVANATVPIFVALLAIRIRPSERATGTGLVGILVGLVGVAVLAGVEPQGGWWAVAGTLAIVLSSLAYARANLYTQDHLPTTPAPVIVCAVGLAGGLLILPAGIAQAPATVPGLEALGAVIALSVLGTAVASIAHYTMLQRYGSARTSLIAYLIPVTALAYGAAILDEPLTLNALLGLALILLGVALGSGVARIARRGTPAAAET
jgi:drug/metabolite transporter (DMT)-like permease